MSSIESWKNNVLYGLKLNPDFREFLVADYVFGRKTKLNPCRNLVDDVKEQKINGENVHVITRSKEDKAADVDMLLEQIANYCPHVTRNEIVKDSESLKEVWYKIRLAYDIQQTGSLINDCFNVKRNLDETPQALFGRLRQMYDDNLLTAGGLHHDRGPLTEDEEMSPTLLNSIILQWLQILHPQLRDLVTQRFITQLRDKTYAAIFPEISRSVNSFLDELSGEATACRIYNNNPPNRSYQFQSRTPSRGNNAYTKPNYRFNAQRKNKCCDFCRVTGRSAFRTHNIDDCLFIKHLPSFQKPSASANQVNCDDPEEEDLRLQFEEFYSETGEPSINQVEHIINHISTDASPILSLISKDNKLHDLTLDSGAPCNLMRLDEAINLGVEIRPSNQRVRMADGETNLEVVGEADTTLYHNQKPLHLNAIICRYMDTKILAGMTFMKQNDIALQPATDEIILGGSEFIKYDPTRTMQGQIRRITNFTVRSQSHQVILPRQFAEFSVPGYAGTVSVEPRWDAKCNEQVTSQSSLWPQPQIAKVTEGKISLNNSTSEPIIVRRLEHVCQIKPEYIPEDPNPIQITEYTTPIKITKPKKFENYSAKVTLNPDKLLSVEEELSFKQMLSTYDTVFDPTISTYNGKSGPCYVEVNMGQNLPPQRKGRLPFYGRGDLVELQNKFDDLESKGIISRPQDIGVVVENTNPSFLVKKRPPSTEKRLVTDFSSIADYCRPTPTVMPDIETTLRNIGSYKFILVTDMSDAYFQILLKHSSKKFCGVHTPLKGLRVYNVGCMGLPGVEVALEELTCLILGDIVKSGKVSKIADDLIIGGRTVQELLDNFQLVLQKFLENNIKLSAKKTVIAPKEVTVLGWIWSAGNLKASPHRLLALSTCQPPTTVTGMRSFLGAYIFLSRVIKGYAKLLAPLEKAIKGKESKEKVEWSDELTETFKKAQKSLAEAKLIAIPRPEDKLLIVTDASVRPGALGATLYVLREGESKPLISSFYNSKLPEFQIRWLPCELEGLCIAAALNHFAPFILQSTSKPQVYTDSKPCVDAVRKLKKGEFSTSTRLSSFLSSVARHQAQVSHISGASNILSDYVSRHPLQCHSKGCSICEFVSASMQTVYNVLSVEKVLDGHISLPFTNRKTWCDVQDECNDLRKVKSFRRSGTIPSKK